MPTHIPNYKRSMGGLVLAAFACLAIALSPAIAASQTGSNKTKKTPSVKHPKKTEAVRTLDAINIEGEIAVPQVLFITSRDYRRYRDGLGLKFRMTSLEVARSADLPTRLRFVAKHKEEER